MKALQARGTARITITRTPLCETSQSTRWKFTQFFDHVENCTTTREFQRARRPKPNESGEPTMLGKGRGNGITERGELTSAQNYMLVNKERANMVGRASERAGYTRYRGDSTWASRNAASAYACVYVCLRICECVCERTKFGTHLWCALMGFFFSSASLVYSMFSMRKSQQNVKSTFMTIWTTPTGCD